VAAENLPQLLPMQAKLELQSADYPLSLPAQQTFIDEA